MPSSKTLENFWFKRLLWVKDGLDFHGRPGSCSWAGQKYKARFYKEICGTLRRLILWQSWDRTGFCGRIRLCQFSFCSSLLGIAHQGSQNLLFRTGGIKAQNSSLVWENQPPYSKPFKYIFACEGVLSFILNQLSIKYLDCITLLLARGWSFSILEKKGLSLCSSLIYISVFGTNSDRLALKKSASNICSLFIIKKTLWAC